MRDTLIAAVNSGYILRQIVGADAEKIHLAGKLRRTKDSGRGFHHDTHLNIFVVGYPFGVEFLFAFR
ncbi:hypothetical protein SDC9_202404 [bioreactor metagenome]|uniref:Uncharacterized protein n=1 Tax=bioreactor metagenome TaxID=1076179 RepID=A0A645IU98_9ZZZZ